MSQPSQVQLGPHRTAFDKLLKEFKHVKPLLGLICEIIYQIHIPLVLQTESQWMEYQMNEINFLISLAWAE